MLALFLIHLRLYIGSSGIVSTTASVSGLPNSDATSTIDLSDDDDSEEEAENVDNEDFTPIVPVKIPISVPQATSSDSLPAKQVLATSSISVIPTLVPVASGVSQGAPMPARTVDTPSLASFQQSPSSDFIVLSAEPALDSCLANSL